MANLNNHHGWCHLLFGCILYTNPPLAMMSKRGEMKVVTASIFCLGARADLSIEPRSSSICLMAPVGACAALNPV